jgi:flagellar hook-length control protein FliK
MGLFESLLKLNSQGSGAKGKLATLQSASLATSDSNNDAVKAAQTFAGFGQQVSASSVATGWQVPVPGNPTTTATAANTGRQSSTVVAASTAKLSVPTMGSSKSDTSLRNVKMTQEDYAGLADRLVQAGVPKEKVEELGKKIQSPEGMTWGQFMYSVQQAVVEKYIKAEPVSDEDKSKVSSLLDRLGFDSKQTSALTDALANGKTGRAFNVISGKLKELDPSQTLTISASEMDALANTLKLSDTSKQKLLGLFGSQENLTLTPESMSQMLGAAKGESSKLLSQVKDVLKQVKDQVDPAMDKATERVGITQSAINSKVESSHVKTSSLLKEPQSIAAPIKEEAKSDAHKSASSDKPAEPGNQKSEPGNQRAEANAAQRDARQPGSPSSGSEKESSQDSKNSHERSWGEFVSKIRTEGASQSSSDTSAASTHGTTAQLFSQAQKLAQTADGHAGTTQSNQLLDQVESGILKNLGQGTKQLSLELSPEDLGKLNVILTVKGKEVQAVIRAESPEAEKMLAENMSQLKQALENQGLTVSKLEVRTSLSQDSNLGQQWAGADKHNLSQEKREALERMRTSTLLAGGSEDLVHQMQYTGTAVKISQGGLDVMA